MGAPTPRVRKGKYRVPLPHLPREVSIEGSLVGRINDLTFFDHDFHDIKKFPNFVPKYYMHQTIIEEGNLPVLRFQKWSLRLEFSGITQFLDVPHFGHSMYITSCVKTLLSVVHGGYLWLDSPYLLTMR